MQTISTLLKLSNWFFSYRKKGLPISYFNDNSFISWFNNERENLKQFYNIHLGEDCFIIGNGPSLNKMNLELLNDYYTFGLNKINLIFKKQDLKLNYHVAVNPLVVNQIQNELLNNIFRCPSFLPFNIESSSLINSERVFKIFTENGAPWIFNSSILKPISEGYTVTFVAMQIAHFMGFKRIFLVGVDHNYFQKGLPNEEQVYQGADLNHFDPLYFSEQKWHLADLEASEVSYCMAKYFFKSIGREIFDATVDGHLNIFKKIDYLSSLDMAKKKNLS